MKKNSLLIGEKVRKGQNRKAPDEPPPQRHRATGSSPLSYWLNALGVLAQLVSHRKHRNHRKPCGEFFHVHKHRVSLSVISVVSV